MRLLHSLRASGVRFGAALCVLLTLAVAGTALSGPISAPAAFKRLTDVTYVNSAGAIPYLGASNGRLSTSIHGPRFTDPSPTTRGGNFVVGYSGNSIGAGLFSCSILGGGLSGGPIQMIYDSGLGVGYYSTTVGGYDILATSPIVCMLAGAHLRYNTAVSSADTYYLGTQGTGTVSSSGTTVTGTSTAFSSFYRPGMVIVAGGVGKRITAIASDTSLTTAVAFSPALSGSAYYQSGWWFANEGHTPLATANHGTVAGGSFQQYAAGAYAVIGGGSQNSIGYDPTAGTETAADGATITGGVGNVVTGAYSTIGGGLYNRLTGSYDFASGTKHIVTANGSAAFGDQITINAPFCFGAGQAYTIATGADYSAAFGTDHNTSSRFTFLAGRSNTAVQELTTILGRDGRANRWGEFVIGDGSFAADGDAQTTILQGRVLTSDATSTPISADGVNPQTSNNSRWLASSTGSANTTTHWLVFVQAQKVGGVAEWCSWKFEFDVERGATVSNVTIYNADAAGTITPITYNQNHKGTTAATFTAGFSADTTNGAIQLNCVGAAATSVRWHATAYVQELGG